MTRADAQMTAEIQADPRFASVDCVFFVLGAQKAGTTWLSHYLKAHPAVSVPEWKEHDYWNMAEGRPQASRMLREQQERRKTPSLLRSLAARLPFTLHARRQRAITLALRAIAAPRPPHSAYADVILENVTDKTLAAGEICPEYALLRAETFAEMARLSPNVRFIFLLRDPLSRFVSGARHGLRKSKADTGTPAQNLSDKINRFLSRLDSRAMLLTRYDRTIAALEAHVPAEQIKYVFFEEMFDQDRVRDICGFLGIPFMPGKIDRKRNIAGRHDAEVSPEDRIAIARALRPVYDAMREKFGGHLPRKWEESASLC